jgi:hypothetical protein
MRCRLNRGSLARSAMILTGVLLVLASPLPAGSQIVLLKGQTVYIPAYSQIYYGDSKRAFDLAVTLSIRNTAANERINVLAVDYHDSDGKLIKHYVGKETSVNAMGSIHFVVQESDKAGGPGAHFIVRWQSANKVSPPIMESIMIGTRSQQGISFTSRGQPLQEVSD